MEKYPRISVITVAYNCRECIEKTIKSVTGLSYDNLEYIVIDGGSTDGTVEIIEQYKDRIAYYVSERDKGIYEAMNKGLAVATGEWVNFMNAGDFFANKDVLNSVVEQMEDDAVIVHGNIIKQCRGFYYFATPAGADKADVQMPVFHQSTFVKLSYHRSHPFDISFKSSGDYNFFYNANFRDKCKFQYIPVVVACFDNTGGMSKDNHSLSIRENLHIWNKEHDIIFKINMERDLFIHNIKMWIKNHFLNANQRRFLELRQLRRQGKEYKLGLYEE